MLPTFQRLAQVVQKTKKPLNALASEALGDPVGVANAQLERTARREMASSSTSSFLQKANRTKCLPASAVS